MKTIIILITLVNLTACATNYDPKLAWWRSQTPSGMKDLPTVTKSGVNIQQIYVNGTGYTVVTPAR